MNNNQNQQYGRFQRKTPIDGISGRSSPRFSQGTSGDFISTKRRSNSHSNLGKSSNSLNDFRRKEGFHSTQQQQITPKRTAPQSSATSLATNVIIDRKNAKHKKRLFGKKTSNLDLSSSKLKKTSKKKKILRIAIVVIIIVALVAGFLFWRGYITLKKVLPGGGSAAALNQNVDPSTLRGEGDGRVNILLLGRGGDGHEGADLTDTIILASIDPLAKEAALVSVPRDLWVTVNGVGSMKINSVFSTGKSNARANIGSQILTDSSKKQIEGEGFKLLEKVIEENLGLPVHYHLMADFTGFKQAVDTVGGVTINAPDSVQENMRIEGQNYFLNVSPGTQKMDGFKALAYSRSRYTSPRGDFDRAERQRVIITALKDKILSPSTFTNPQKINELVSNFGNHVQTNFDVRDMQRLYQLSQQIPAAKIRSVGLADPPNNYVTTSNIGGASVVIPTAGASDFSEIQSFLRNALKDSFLKKESATVMVLNGTLTTGLATKKGDELKSFGYTISKVGNAPTKQYAKTVVVDMTKGKKEYTKNYLEKRFKVKSTTTLPDNTITATGSDFVIILGSDQSN